MTIVPRQDLSEVGYGVHWTVSTKVIGFIVVSIQLLNVLVKRQLKRRRIIHKKKRG